MSSQVSLPVTPPSSDTSTPASSVEEMYNRLRPIAFIHRGNNLLVPLIAVDELPPGVTVREVSRNLRMEFATGMTNLGTFPPTGEHYTLEGLENVQDSASAPRPQQAASANQTYLTTRRFYAPDAFVNRSAGQGERNVEVVATVNSVATNGSNVSMDTELPYNKNNWMRNRQSTNVSEQTELFPMALARTSAASSELSRPVNTPQYTGSMALRLLPPSGREPVLENKTHCTYWLKTGCCDYLQQGCKYKHEMPDAAGRVAIGLSPDPPKWWKDRQLHNWRAPANPNARSGEDPTVAFNLPRRALTTPASPALAPRQSKVQRPLTSVASTVSPPKVPARQFMKTDSPAQRQIDAIIRAPEKPPAVIPGFETLQPTPASNAQRKPASPPQQVQSAPPIRNSQPFATAVQSNTSLLTPTLGMAASRHSPGARFIPAGEAIPSSAVPITRRLGSPFSTPSPPDDTSSENLTEVSPSTCSTKAVRPAAVSPTPSSTKPLPSSLPRSSPRSVKSVRSTATSPRVAKIKEATSSSEDIEDDEQAEIYPEHKRRSEIPQPKFQMRGIPKTPKTSRTSKIESEASIRAPRNRPGGLGPRGGRVVRGKIVYDQTEAPRHRSNGKEVVKESRRARAESGPSRRPKRSPEAQKEVQNGEQDLLDLSI